jgi:ABC-type antimicrobial peptide transport system permease subunit
VLRAVGAGPQQVLLLLATEGALLTLAGAVLGAAVAALAVWGAGPWVQQRFGITLLPGAHGRAMGAVSGGGGRGYACQPGARMARLPPVAGRRALPTNLKLPMLRLLPATTLALGLTMCAAVGAQPKDGVPLMKPPHRRPGQAGVVAAGHPPHHHLGCAGAGRLGPRSRNSRV